MMPVGWLFADFEEAIRGIIILVGILVFLANWIGGALKKAAQAQKQAARPQQPQAPGAPQPQELRNEVEDFLRRAMNWQQEQDNERIEAAQAEHLRAEQAARGAQAVRAPRQQQMVADDRLERRRRRSQQRQQQQQEQSNQPPVLAQPIGAKRTGREPLSKLSSSYASDSTEVVASMADDSDRFDEATHAAFDHKLGSFDAQQSGERAAVVERPATSPIAEELRQVLQDPQRIRSAFVLAEILQRPTSRW